MKIYFFASFGRLKQLTPGGGETSARRLWHTLESLGFDVEIFNRHRFYWVKQPFGALLTLPFAFLDPLWVFFSLLIRRRKDAVFLFIGYAIGRHVFYELLMAYMTRLTGYKTVLYLKSGAAQYFYRTKGGLYRWAFRKMVSHFDMALCEGEKHVDLIQQVTGGSTRAFYLPNFTENAFFPPSCPAKPTDVVNIVYFGRLHRAKQILLIIHAFEILCQTHHNIHLTLVGSGEPSYVALIDHACKHSSYREKITQVSHVAHADLAGILEKQHIYILPSIAPTEGHANALSEAMSWGVVPIVSSNNFLPGIAGDVSLVVSENTPVAYAEAVSRLLNSHTLEKKSAQAYRRAKENYSQEVIENRLKTIFSTGADPS